MGKLLEQKIVSVDHLVLDKFFDYAVPRVCANIPTPGKLSLKLVTTNGVFDILHPGAVKCLEQAKARGQILLVLVNTDASVERIKGAPRPYNRLEDRMVCLAALESVDYVSWFDEDTPCDALLQLYSGGVGPHIHVKGGDYKEENMPETKIVHQYGGIIHIQDFVYDTSTTKVAEGIITAHAQHLMEGRN